ncbi:DNA-directed RNA polymerase subunit beta [Frankliniella fusca]|uniref:DNA-directed RNA polymerase subunit beta n=1 Tax=Frankliniella fusca TaxID=407009 RepID=A0AAE1I110_9NEOP|nr:DNA-directed RNA polymerase subunit beta [Frankliniella fusca]
MQTEPLRSVLLNGPVTVAQIRDELQDAYGDKVDFGKTASPPAPEMALVFFECLPQYYSVHSFSHFVTSSRRYATGGPRCPGFTWSEARYKSGTSRHKLRIKTRVKVRGNFGKDSQFSENYSDYEEVSLWGKNERSSSDKFISTSRRSP